MGTVFGSTLELVSFMQIFFGTLVLAGLYFAARHFREGLALPGVPRFDWTVLLLGLWCFTGMIIDAWAHKHGEVDDSFFTPWHAIWYSGFTAFAGYITFALWRLHEGDFPKSLASIKEFLGNMPNGYSVGVLGMVLFALSGFGDMLWHTFLGIEGGTDILLSPTHLGLAAGLILSLMTPVMAAWYDSKSGTNRLPSQILILFGIGASWSVITLFTSFAHHQTLPFTDICGVASSCSDGNIGLENGITSILLQSLILSGVVLLFMQRWTPVFGTFTLLLSINGVAIAAFAPGQPVDAWQHLITPVLAGLALDFVYTQIGDRIRLFSFMIPALHTAIWMLVMIGFNGWQTAVVGGDLVISPLGWSVHATLGAIFFAGGMGILVSILTHPPNLPDTVED